MEGGAGRAVTISIGRYFGLVENKAAFGLVRAEEHDRRAQPIDLDAAEDRRAIFGVRLT